MSNLKFTDETHWAALERYLTSGRGERFAFAHTRLLAMTSDGPILEVIAVELIDDADVEHADSGWYVSDRALDQVHSGAAVGGYGLVEFHNHRLAPPAFSRTDESGLTPMAEYVTGLLPDRPYGAGVYAGGRLHAEHWTATAEGMVRGRFRTVTVMGDQLRTITAGGAPVVQRLDRQAGILGESGRATLASLRVAVVGAGGTGSHVALALAYLGVHHVVLLDDDHVEVTNLNRLVTAGIADIGAPKNLVARRRMREIDPTLGVQALPALLPDGGDGDLGDVDLIIGCVDHDGPRDRLNQIAVDTATPYIDIATGIDATSAPPVVGGRVIIVVPGGACLHCLRELDAGEITRWAKDAEQQALDRRHGYGTPAANPSVVHLNGLAVHAAVGELIAWVSGHRPPAQYLDIDLSGHLVRTDGAPGCRVAPRRPVPRTEGCFSCGRPAPGGSGPKT